jgi:RNA polymerase sigma-70 factor (ECF subfamily)
MRKMALAVASQKQCLPLKDTWQEHFKENCVKSKTSLYEQLIGPIEGQMMRSIWRIVRNAEAAEDTLQDALAIIWRRLDRIRSHPNPHALILKICTNAAIDSWRKRNRHLQHEKQEELHNLPSQSNTDAPETLEKKETETEIRKAITRLPRKQAVAVLMRIVQEQPYDAIAKTLGCKEVTARIHVSRGRVQLSRWLSHLYPASIREE